jgi:hypothetical protein
MVEVWEVDRGRVALRTLTVGEAVDPPRAHPKAFKIEDLACWMREGERSEYFRSERKVVSSVVWEDIVDCEL